MVPVLDQERKPLMPCSEKRARLLMDRKQAKPFWYKGLFCIILIKEPSDRKYQEVALGIDPGSKREGYTVATNKSVVLNITSNTPYWVKDHVETRRNLRRIRRYRKTPYRKRRNNRSFSRKINRIPPSTKARWQAKIRIVNSLIKINGKKVKVALFSSVFARPFCKVLDYIQSFLVRHHFADGGVSDKFYRHHFLQF